MRSSREVVQHVPAPAVSPETEMSWTQIVETAGKLAEEWRADGSLAWYRGHAEDTWELKCTLHREVEDFVIIYLTQV